MSDDELVQKVCLGEKDAAEELIKRYYPSILRYCRWHCKSPQEAEDLTQETFFRLFKSLKKYDGKKKFKAYLYTIANHLCIDQRRKARWDFLEEENLVQECEDILGVEQREEIDSLLKVISPEQREAVLLRYGEELSFSEIAKVTGCNLRTVQSRVRSALKIMRREQREHEG